MSLPVAYTLLSLVLDLAQMVLAVRKHLQMTNIIMLEKFYHYNFPDNQSLGKSLPLTYTSISLVLDLAQMVLAAWKHLLMTKIFMLDSFFLQLSQ